MPTEARRAKVGRCEIAPRVADGKPDRTGATSWKAECLNYIQPLFDN
jgi:hypothetical protein